MSPVFSLVFSPVFPVFSLVFSREFLRGFLFVLASSCGEYSFPIPSVFFLWVFLVGLFCFLVAFLGDSLFFLQPVVGKLFPLRVSGAVRGVGGCLSQDKLCLDQADLAPSFWQW